MNQTGLYEIDCDYFMVHMSCTGPRVEEPNESIS
jgi:hypothetical protein